MKKACKICGKEKVMFSWEDTCYSCQKEQELKRIQEEIAAGEEEVDTYSTDYVICPYCGHAYKTDVGYEDFPEIFDEGDNEIECGYCGMTYILETTVSYSWETRRTDNSEVR